MTTPNITVTIEPVQNGMLQFLKCAPAVAGDKETGQINVILTMTNNESFPVYVLRIEMSVPGSATGPKLLYEAPLLGMELPPGKPIGWVQPEDYIFELPPSSSMTLKLYTTNAGDLVVTTPIAAHVSPTAVGNYRFWGAVRDLRAGEFWQVHGFGHAQAPAQLFGYDVGVGVEAGAGYDGRLPGVDDKKNEHYRIWGKAIYAIADGTVKHFRNDFPTNQTPRSIDPDIEKFWTSEGKDGNGNFFTIATGSETVLYAHMQAGSLNPALMSAGAPVRQGDFLGLVGNSGASSHPHLHIHANRTNGGSTSWVDLPRPLPFRHATAVRWSSLGADAPSAPWVRLNGRGLPTADCAVWPSDVAAVNLAHVTVRHFAIRNDGQVWIVKTDNEVRTTSDRLPGSGLFFDVNPGGLAKETAVRGKPYVIGMNDRVWEGLASGWQLMANSPSVLRVTVDDASEKVWVVTLDNRILSFAAASGVWTEHPGNGRAKDICVHAGVPYIVGMDDRVYRGDGVTGWAALAGHGRGKRIAADGGTGTLWLIGMGDGVWSYNAGVWTEHPGGGRAKELAVHNGLPYVIGMNDVLWRSAGLSGWQQMNLVAPA